MNENIFKFVKYAYIFSLIATLIIYLFPGSIIGYFLYGDFGKQPILVENPIGNSINHFICFAYLTFLSLIYNYKNKIFIFNIYFLFSISIIFEFLHIFIPNRAFEIYDLIANVLGVIIILILQKILKWPKLS